VVADLSEHELCERYEALYTGVVADVLDDYGYEDQTLGHRIEPLDRDMRAAGIAYPAVGRANRSVDPDRQVRRFLRMVDEAPEDSMLVMNTNDTTAAHIGELTTTALENNGCRGAVIQGGLRDTEFVLDRGYPVFVSHRTPLDSIIRWELVDWNTTAVVGGVTVSPGRSSKTPRPRRRRSPSSGRPSRTGRPSSTRTTSTARSDTVGRESTDRPFRPTGIPRGWFRYWPRVARRRSSLYGVRATVARTSFWT
jgi:regulator of RNase E activity RraA